MNKYKFFDKTKLKALILSGVTLLSTVACGKSSVEKPTPGSSVTIETEDNTEKTTKTKLEQNVGKEYQKIEQNGNQTTNYYEDNTEYDNNYVDNNEDPTEERTESKTESKTEAKTESKTEAKTESKTEAKTESKTEAKTTSKIIPIIGGHKVQGSYEPTPTTTKIKNSDIKVTTTKVTTQKPTTTKKPVTTTVKVTEPPVVTQPPRTDFNKYDLLDSDPAVAARAFEKLSSDFCKELYRGYSIPSYYGDTNGYNESKVMLAILNHNQGISPQALASDEALGQYSEDQLYNYSDAIDFAQIENITGARIDFRKYVIDEDFANFLNTTNNAWINYVNGDEDEYIRYSDEYIANNNFNDIQSIDDYSKFYYMVVCDYNIGLANENSFNQAEQLYDDNVVRPMYDTYSPYIGHSYSR